jgi:hypothetical protein
MEDSGLIDKGCQIVNYFLIARAYEFVHISSIALAYYNLSIKKEIFFNYPKLKGDTKCTSSKFF